MPDPTGQDEKDKGLPLDFYGKSYLGKDVHVGVQGEGPTAGAEGAIPTGALGVGPTGAGGAPASATGGATAAGATGEVGTSAANTALQGASLASKIVKLAGSEDDAAGAGLTFGPNTNLTAGLPEGQAALSATLPASNVLDSALNTLPQAGSQGLNLGAGLTTTLPEGAAAAEAGTAAGNATSTAAGLSPEGVAAVIPAIISALQVAGVPIPKEITAPEQFGSLGELSSATNFATNPSLTSLGNLALSIGTFGLSDVAQGLLGGPPPAMSFPTSSWTAMAHSVNKSLPPELTAPANATPEQAAQVEAVNKLIGDIRSTYGGAPPPSLNGQQSAETWGNVWQDYTSGAKAMFKQLQTLYPKAAQALQSTQAPASAQLENVAPPPASTDEGSVMPPGFFEGTDQEKKKVAA